MIRQSIYLVFFFCLTFSSKLWSQDFYDIDSIQQISITFVESNWDYLLDSLKAIGDDRLIAQNVTVNGVSYDSAGVRFKGNSSFSPNNSKNPLNIKLSNILDQDYQGYQTFKLSSGKNDPSLAREVISYEIARNYMPVSKANYVKVYINGVWYGLFTNVESVNKDFLENYYASNDNILFKCDGTQGVPPVPWCPPGGGSGLSYLGLDSSCYFGGYELKRDYGWNSLVNAIDVLNNNFSDIEQAFYVDRALWMLAFNNVLVVFDSYTGSLHNYYIYQDKNDRFNTIIWDLNAAFGVFKQGSPGVNMSIPNMKVLDPLHNSNSQQHPLIQKLLANSTYKKTYIAHMRTILAENFSNGWYSSRLTDLKNILAPTVQTDPNSLFPYQAFLNNYNVNVGMSPGLTDFISARTSYLETNVEITKTPPVVSVPAQNPGIVQTNDTVWITSSVTNANAVKLRYRFGQYDVFSEKDMLDDGTQMDGAAGDGTYGAFMIIPATGAQYYVYAENNDAAMLSPERAEYEFYTITTSSGLIPASLVINEFMASNVSAFADQDGEFDDWVELYNNTSSPIDLLGLYLSDNFGNSTKWAFPDTSIAANGYLIVWVDDDMSQAGLHTGFKLSSAGEELALFDNSGNLLDSFSFSSQSSNITTGRFPNGTGPFISMTPTPGAVNVDNSAIEQLNPLTKNWTIYPNPLRDQQLMISLEMERASWLKCSVLNVVGQEVWQEQFLAHAGINKRTIANKQWPAGIYTLTVQDESAIQSKQFVKL